MSGCDRERLEAFVAGSLDAAPAAEVRAHLASCARCAEEAGWLRAERRLFSARAAISVAVPPFSSLLTRVRRERKERLRTAVARRAPWLGLAAAAAVLAVAVTTRGPVAPEVVAEPPPSLACYDDPRSLDAEATAYATDRAIATAEDRFAACLVATPRASPACALPVETNVTCGPLGPPDDEVFESRIRGGSLQ
jgi:hypothetical protein